MSDATIWAAELRATSCKQMGLLIRVGVSSPTPLVSMSRDSLDPAMEAEEFPSGMYLHGHTTPPSLPELNYHIFIEFRHTVSTNLRELLQRTTPPPAGEDARPWKLIGKLQTTITAVGPSSL